MNIIIDMYKDLLLCNRIDKSYIWIVYDADHYL